MSDSNFACPECGKHLGSPERARWVEELQGLRRDRTCEDGHQYPTVERIDPRAFLRKTRIVSPTGSKLYSTDQLQSDLSLKLEPVLSKKTRNEVVNRVESRLVLDWRKRRAPRTLAGSTLSQTVVSVLRDYSDERELTKQVADALRRSHVLYALSQEALEFREGSKKKSVPLAGDGFDALPDILEWLLEWYPALKTSAGRRQTPHYSGEPRTDRWHTLRRDAGPAPKTLLRRVIVQQHMMYTDEDGTLDSLHEPTERWEAIRFDERVYLRSVSRAFAGRPGFEHLTHYSAQWVYFALAGQETVRVSDLVAMTTQCLRRVDAVASLRWAIIAKNLTPAALVTEILGMLEWPAPRLRFESHAAADMRTSSQMQPGHHGDLPDDPEDDREAETEEDANEDGAKNEDDA